MREHVSRQKKTTTGFSIPSLKQPIRGFGLESSAISRQAIPKIQPLHKPVTHDISRIPLRTQAKLSISQPGDKYEQEADSVAQQVMQTMAQPVNRQSIQREEAPEDEEELQMKPLANSITPLVQREALPEDEEELQMKFLDNSTLQREALPEDEEELQMKSLDNSTLQREALPEGEEELQMKSLDNSTLQREALPEDEEELQMKSLDNSTLQREALPEDEEELQMKPMVQRQANAGMAATPDLEASINQARGGGQLMADNIREPMERAFGADFSGVKVHTDGQSDQLNRSIQARAFTTGQDVFFRSGEYNPGSRGGQELLAHELTHVVQQNGGIQRYLSHEQPSLQRELNITSYLVQKTPIGGPQHNYTANNSSNTFISDHLAQTEAQAETATLNRANNGRGTTNTVLMETDANVKDLVLGADYDAAEPLGGPIWKVPINCNYIIIRAAHGADNNIIRERGSVQNGRVWVKVYFNEQGRTISITGVWGQ
ncbi:MAG: DUF4157 domain-containing protein [Nostoc sp. DedQUE05]|uniref:eCIS core domain-containing protein n=1 Tax=Nostoc sp. DedQUE05 TaxID=3075391 RepID=UPI002AD36A78|nr:DUF4157 domain-containing protein [Nostoc sp. DedQUE05]MDZ8092275.1 DUF4157 domain-containing protein [Nostoc sp. DedQUE05]